MVGFHVLYHEIIGCTPFEGSFEFLHPLLCFTGIHGVHHGHLVIQQQITVVAHAFRGHVLALKEVHLGIVTADILDVCFHVEYVVYYCFCSWMRRP